jgi:hypothetical protein
MTYKGYSIERIYNGFYVTKSQNVGWLKADTLAGIKQLINEESKS